MSMMKRKRRMSGSNWPSKARAIGRVAFQGYKAYRSLTGSRSGQKSVETTPLTDQRDVVTTYRKKYMPKRKKRRYVRSLRRWQSSQLRLSPSRFFVYLDTQNVSWSTNTSRYFGAFSGLYAQNAYDNNFGEAWNNITNTAAASSKASAGKFRLDHQSLRVVLRNTTTAEVGSTPTVDIDVYKVICIRDVPLDLWTSGLAVESFLAIQKNTLRQATGMDIEVSTAGAGIATAQQNAGTSSTNQVVGDSLWNNPMFLRYFKVLKSFKVQLGSNNQTEFSWRDSKNRYVAHQDCFDVSSLACKRGVTRGYIFNVNGRAYYPGVSPTYQAGSVICEQYVRYNVKVVAGSSPTLVYDGT